MIKFCFALIYLNLLVSADVISIPYILEIEEERFITDVGTAHKCRACVKEECFIPPGPCPFGTYLDRCNHINCYQGPGDFCTGDPLGPFHCAKQLTCYCNECRGCIRDSKNRAYLCKDGPPCKERAMLVWLLTAENHCDSASRGSCKNKGTPMNFARRCCGCF